MMNAAKYPSVSSSSLLLLLVSMPFLMVCGRAAVVQQCPPSFLISPCVCSLSDGLAAVTCSGLTSLQSLVDVFQRSFPTDELDRVTVSGSQLAPLPDNVFGTKSFRSVEFSANRGLSVVNERVLEASRARLETLVVRHDSDGWSFSLNNVAGFAALRSLQAGRH